jgi:hypothetical protein
MGSPSSPVACHDCFDHDLEIVTRALCKRVIHDQLLPLSEEALAEMIVHIFRVKRGENRASMFIAPYAAVSA